MRTETKYKIYADFFRASRKSGIARLIKSLFQQNYIGFNYIFTLRLHSDFHAKKRNIFERICFRLLVKNLKRLQIKYGIEIPHQASIGEGLLIPHFGGIVIHPNVKIGKNCTILQGVTIGNNLFKSREDVATIGDNVTIAAGAKIVGPVTIGDNVTIGANSVVTSDIEPNCIVAGMPATIISRKESIVLNTDYLSFDEYQKR
ncbi:serine O-acetyltransferase [Serratia marcescens]|uniref:serine O-acetyltransferase n=1 Tax=Serratia marcescens TaxID=615 RepID=UPI00066CECA2|nr:serine acetyltransferase [Serratia marcescens]MBH2972205.1 serine acetyltransferase [Serratia marcescens]MBH2978127.1 serine acetyltransferase [Serratia marcescens]MBN3985259.1 serine acetyltransferase [Serratia marcescens]MBN5326861.1 serine acetyltransferase [Serratia marcescens]MBN5347772.1 serine acetyltransferase [Serratia marcescens]